MNVDSDGKKKKSRESQSNEENEVGAESGPKSFLLGED